ncbi:hypothetical protein VFPPC_15837 [Pochonia chlamydosporia 170]|uniref:Uncharacterized protein n=1 Tax=Pochonia chlamydosporia 170 TaxID=1380566 RepID=A0A179FSD8_METCM|nr:hypothetical protein VFPPC_15837 [Pochonia chlamydosporia 170]OAQ68535.1 hypothetical protein VFPPC_15837 [Pochonia chlamydosporia 170]
MSGPPIPCCSLKFRLELNQRTASPEKAINHPGSSSRAGSWTARSLQFAANCPRCLLVDLSMLEDQA